jgi:site-specific recombinase XerD
VTSIEAAIEWYLAAYEVQFTSQDAARARRAQLMRFVEHLRALQHSLQLADLTYGDGRAFLDALTNIYTGEPVSPSIRISHKSALRSFSRFLYKSNLIEEDVFFLLKVI